MFLTWPFNVEAVAWASGIFDVLVTTLVLSAVVVMNSDMGEQRRILIVAMLTAAATLSKETGITTPLLLALMTSANRGLIRSRRLIVVSAAVVGLYIILRLALAPPTPFLTDAVIIKNKLITRPFGALAMGLHEDILRKLPWIATGLALGWPALLARAAHRWSADVFRNTCLGTAWVLISVAPLWSWFYVSGTLEGARYLYLGSSIWAVGIVTLIANGTVMTIATSGIAGALIVGSVAAAVFHQEPWLRAAAMREIITAAWSQVNARCDPRKVSGLVDSTDGAYVFRNGFAEAVGDRTATYSESCMATWKDGTFIVTKQLIP